MAFATSRTLGIGVDSGAAVSVAPASWFVDYLLHGTEESMAGTFYCTANGAQVADQGTRYLLGYPEGCQEVRGLRLRAVQVTKPLLSVSEMVDAGYSVIFDSDHSCAVHKRTGVSIPIHRRDKIYEMRWDILDYEDAKKHEGFQRQASAL